jgi:putative transposase
MRRTNSEFPIVDRRPILEDALEGWRNHQQLSLENKQSLLYYIREPEGLGVLRAYTSYQEEAQFQIWLSEQP